ncbi:HGE-14 family type IV secretion system effector [Anaplasma phagocytophilum]|uniref:HGE-14 family type IV secretion system effector n=1 Tax=Anaplasma phagocytophilum TaxID=948 RepID=UPI002010936F|nr:hypothetical protein [Anaplasma phagocytophilum]UQD53986.1 hypothetical protein ESP60_00575 [Anaplasma phagocytophilum]
MHTPRIFTSPAMSGYAYSGLSSTEYKDSLCRAITSGLMPYDEFLKVLREFMLELRSTFNEIRGLDSALEENASRIESIECGLCSFLSSGAAARDRVLRELTYNLCDVLYGCATAACNQDVSLFMDPGFIRRGAHLQIAKVCGILVNAIAITNYRIGDLFAQGVSVVGEGDDSSTFRAALALSTNVNARSSALSLCLNSSLGPEEVRYRKAILRMVRHNIELANKVVELFDENILHVFRVCTECVLKRILHAVESSSAKCEEMVSDDASARNRLTLAKKAKTRLVHYLGGYDLGARPVPRYFETEGHVCALVHTIGSLFLMYRGYAATGNADHNVAGIIENCLKILLTLPPSTRRSTGEKVRKVYVDMCSVYKEIEQHLRPELLLNPGVEVKWRDAALRYLSEMMNIWAMEYGEHFNAVEQTGASPSQPSASVGTARTGSQQACYVSPHDPGMMPYSYAQPSTSGLGGTARTGSQQACYVSPHDPGMMPYSYAQPSTSGLGGTARTGSQQACYVSPHDPGMMPYSYAQPSTSGLGGTARTGSQQACYVSPHDPGMMPYSYAQPSTSGLGGTARTGSQQACYVSPHDPGMMPYSYAQPSTSGLGGTARTGSQQACYVSPHDPGMMPYSYAQPSTSGLGGTARTGSQQACYVSPHDPGMMPYSYAQPSTSGLGGTARTGSQQACYVSPHDPGMMPYSYAQPSTSGLGGTARTGSQQACYVSPHDPGTMPYSYAQPSTSCDQPSTSGLGCASSTLEEVQVSSHRSRTPSDDSEPPSKRSRSA